jgi:hypothetical protein
MRPTDVCHPYELRVPVPRAFPARCRDLHRVGTPRSLGLRAVLPGEGVFHGTRNRFGGSFRNTTGFISRPRFVRSPRGDRQLRAWAFCSHGAWNLRSCLWHPCRLSLFRRVWSRLRDSFALASELYREEAAETAVTTFS